MAREGSSVCEPAFRSGSLRNHCTSGIRYTRCERERCRECKVVMSGASSDAQCEKSEQREGVLRCILFTLYYNYVYRRCIAVYAVYDAGEPGQ